MNDYDDYLRDWYSALPLEEKAETDAISDMYEEYDFIMDCTL